MPVDYMRRQCAPRLEDKCQCTVALHRQTGCIRVGMYVVNAAVCKSMLQCALK